MSNVWVAETDTIYDQSIYEKGDEDAAVVWRKKLQLYTLQKSEKEVSKSVLLEWGKYDV